jgi:hypothetical protein
VGRSLDTVVYTKQSYRINGTPDANDSGHGRRQIHRRQLGQLPREKYPEDRTVVLDILTYAGSIENLPKDMLQGQHPLQRFPYGDVCNAELVDTLAEEADIVIFAAETQVTRSMDE